jgi:hypothetical protein
MCAHTFRNPGGSDELSPVQYSSAICTYITLSMLCYSRAIQLPSEAPQAACFQGPTRPVSAAGWHPQQGSASQGLKQQPLMPSASGQPRQRMRTDDCTDMNATPLMTSHTATLALPSHPALVCPAGARTRFSA